MGLGRHDDFWCPRCRTRLPFATGAGEPVPLPPGYFGELTEFYCRTCGAVGRGCCRGKTVACRLYNDGFCGFHCGYITGDPQPPGFEARSNRELDEHTARMTAEHQVLVARGVICKHGTVRDSFCHHCDYEENPFCPHGRDRRTRPYCPCLIRVG